jgi:tetratricopeptide (TPR) repeat protein
MIKNLSLFILCFTLQVNAWAQSAPGSAQTLADEALSRARAGQNKEALALYRQALAVDSDNETILRDYAVVLGWNEQYADAIATIKKLRQLQNDQPLWALREFARSYLFGGAASEALSVLNEMIEKDDQSETTLTRRGLALRWLGRRNEALQAYRASLAAYPHSTDSVVGVAYALADDNKLSEALRFLDSTDATGLDNIQVLKAKIRILNWMGRHYEAQKLLARMPLETGTDREILEDRIAAARWGGKPDEAARELNTLVSMFPGESSSRLRKDFRAEFGHSVTPTARYGEDSDGLIDRTAGADVSLHINPAHVIRIGYQYRLLEHQQEVRNWLRYELGWTARLHRRIALYTTAARVNYRRPVLDRKFVGDGSLEIAASDTLRFSAGGGSIMMDAYNAVARQVTAPFGFGEVVFSPSGANKFQARYSRFAFTDDVKRDRADFEAMHSVVSEARVKFNIGWRSNVMWHGRQTDDFYSPLRFHSHLAVAQSYGHVASWLEYWGEVGGGWQSESMTPTLHPLQAAARLVWHPSRTLSAIMEAGRSTSSLDRPSTGLRTYSRRVISASIQVRFP